jgi:hypothetical protein
LNSFTSEKEIVMNPIRRIRRMAAVLAVLAAGLVAFATPAFAMEVPASGGGYAPAPAPQLRTVTHTLVVGGMAGWQIVLIAAAAALLAAAVAVAADRAWTTRRKPATAAA